MDDSTLLFLIARILTCGTWIGAGLFKIFHFNETTEKLAGFGFPVPALFTIGVIGIELVGSTFLIVNIAVWAVGIVWIAFTIWATLLEHRHVIAPDGTLVFAEYVQICKNISLVGGIVILILLDQSRPDWLF